MTAVQTTPTSGFSRLLKLWRGRRRLSQLDLSMEAGMSQRHLSFLETGRSKPSRSAISQLGEALGMPAAEVDALLVSAGFAARSSNVSWGEATRRAVDVSIEHVLRGHEPYPAVAIDRIWNLQKANGSAQRFFAAAGSSGNPNLLRELMMPGRLRNSIMNWEDVARALFRLLELEIARRPTDAEASGLVEELRQLPGIPDAIAKPAKEDPSPVLTLQFRIAERDLKLFSLIATIGMSADASLDDVRLETLLPADTATRDWFESFLT
ncbi:MAG: helix-turn-helix transcriptional regulator [Pseudomonadota bacterium]